MEYNPLDDILRPLECGDSHLSVGDTVRLTRPVMFDNIPVGCQGTIVSIERPNSDWEASSDYFKGRTVTVKFDLRPHKVPFPKEMRQVMMDRYNVTLPAYQEFVETAVRPDKIEKVD